MEKLTSKLSERERARLHPEFLENEDSYWRIRDSLLPRYRGKWVAVRAGDVVAEADEVFTVLDRIAEIGGHPYIALVGDEHREFKVRRVFDYDPSYQPVPLPRVTARFSGPRPERAATFEDVIPDTGADLSVLPEGDGEVIGLLASPYFTITVGGITGHHVAALVYRGFVDIAGFTCRSLIQVMGSRERILGRDVLNQLRVTFDGPRRLVEIEGAEAPP